MKRAQHDTGIDYEVERLLAQHYIDGTIYFTSLSDLAIFEVACERGLVSKSGLLTDVGRRWVTADPWPLH